MSKQRRDIQVRQGAINFPIRTTMASQSTAPFVAKVTQVYSERMTCDVETVDGQPVLNVSVLSDAGLVDGEPYGKVCLPAIDDYVIVVIAGTSTRHKVIIGTVFPYLSNEFQKDSVNSASKSTLTKLLESGKSLEYRRVFKSGASIQVQSNGTIVVEAPDGSIVQIGAGASGITLNDSNGNSITMGVSSVTVNGNLEVLQ